MILSNRYLRQEEEIDIELGSISAVFSSPVFDPPEKERGVSAGSYPEQRLVIEPNIEHEK